MALADETGKGEHVAAELVAIADAVEGELSAVALQAVCGRRHAVDIGP